MKLHGFFVAKKKLISGVCVVGETRISIVPPMRKNFSNNKFMDFAKVTKKSLPLQR